MRSTALMILMMTTSLAGFGISAAPSLAHGSAPLPGGHGHALHQEADLVGKEGNVSQILGSSLSELPEISSNFTSFALENGLQVVVIPDHRAPVATHMVWYKVGAADEAPGESGIAHFLEHLMFKGTKAYPDGEFSRIIASVGGQENAFTSQDYTAYYQRVAKEHLPKMMEMESDRMANLVLRDDQVAPELQVVHEERASRVDNNPAAQLSEALQAVLYRNHPYGIPIIGWDHEISKLNRETALAFYDKYYTPNNAILIVAGDVSVDEVKKLAQETYGKVKRRAEPGPRVRPSEPPSRTARTVTLRHDRVKQPSVRRAYLVPSDATAKDDQAEALRLLGYILGSGTNSRLYKALVIDQKLATSAGAYYQSGSLDDSSFILYGSPSADHDLQEVLAGIDTELTRLIDEGISDKELLRAKKAILSEAFYAQDSQATLARIVGSALTTGSSLEHMRGWPKRLAGVKAETIIEQAKRYLQEHRSVTGYLLPPAAKMAKKPAQIDRDMQGKRSTPDPMAKPESMEKPDSMKKGAKANPPLPRPDKGKTSPHELPKAANRMGDLLPKDAPRGGQLVPTPRSRPQAVPRAKPAADAKAEPKPSTDMPNQASTKLPAEG